MDTPETVEKSTPEKDAKEIKALERRRLELEVQAKEAELQDIQERLAERKMKRDNKESRSRVNGATLKQIAAIDAANQERCNHHKGGNGVEGLVGGQGDDAQYAVLKHRFANGDIWVRCLRCGKTWKPPYQEDFEKNGKLDKDALNAALAEYKAALNFQTRNVMSSGIVFTFSDGGDDYRAKTKNVTLR